MILYAFLTTTPIILIHCRYRNFMNTSFQMYTDGIDPADIRQVHLCPCNFRVHARICHNVINKIQQGYLADCWLLCAIASLAEFPYLIEVIAATFISAIIPCYIVCFSKPL
jgi:hypothetical protein